MGHIAGEQRFLSALPSEAGLLRNPGHDADALEAALTPLGFQVAEHKDLNKAGLETAVRDFYRRLSKGSVALFFYSGHGLQKDGENYLLPVQTSVEEEYEVSNKCYPISQVLESLEKSPSHLNVVILDCCRNNPFQRSWTRSSPAKGLAVISVAPRGTLIAYATAPGKTASDGEGNNSSFTRHLCDVLTSRPAGGLELVDAFREASLRVKRETQQDPWLNMGTLERFYLVPAAVVASDTNPGRVGRSDATPPTMPPKPPADSALEKEFTNSIGVQLVLIPKGEFLMGSPDGEPELSDDEGPQHRVRITRPFYLGVHEVTQQQYEAVMGKSEGGSSALT